MHYPSELKNFLSGQGEALSVYKSGQASQVELAKACLRQGISAVLVVPGPSELNSLKSLLKLLCPFDGQDFWKRPWQALPPYPAMDPSPAAWARRFAFLYSAARSNEPRILALTCDNFLPKWPSQEVILDHSLSLRQGEEILIEMLAEELSGWGYERRPLVSSPGEFAWRGDIFDVFPPGYSSPLRLEFFGEEIETIRSFDPVSQRSLSELESVLFLPATPAVLSEKLKGQARENFGKLAKVGELSKPAAQHLDDMIIRGDGRIWPGIYYERPSALEDWFAPDAVYFLTGAQLLRARIEETDFAWREYQDKKSGDLGFAWPRNHLLWPAAKAYKSWVGKRQIVFDDLVLGQSRNGLDLPEKKIDSFQDLFWKPEDAKRPWSAIVGALRDYSRSKTRTILSFHSQQSRKKFLKMAEHEGLEFSLEFSPDTRGLQALVSPLKRGADIVWQNALILPEDVLRPESAEPQSRKARQAFKGLAEHDDLKPGMLLVHRDYGVCRFDGLGRLSVGLTANDYLFLVFDGEDKLYLPVDRLGLVQRFKGPEGVNPALDRLGGSRFKNAREKAKKAIELIAQDLVEMYAFRKVAKGYAYGPLSELYWEFEATFGFDETPDQEKAIEDVLADMENPAPMDRLVCGDVGFGKTEVALRASFRAVLDGKQVALLCPTTVLAEQHYLNFSKRMEAFPVQVAMLSRFVPAARQKAVIDSAKRGAVDILIGTHRLLSKDVELPRLGLLILDEEQRFGVKHKEKLKAMRKNIDVLTLTATPIPRTLQLSLSGVRNLSVIETPPAERKPVQTALIEREPGMLQNIISRELERHGQIFFVHNRVSDLEEVCAFVRKLAPEARIGMAHGQMSEKPLEKAMHDFWHGEIDILVCTAIIESGLDFPRANTLIVDQAQNFGLGQLYQLRGRVGRSERQAFAYFVVPSLDKIPEIARERLRVILDLDYLGAGFQLAMEDLRLRGAGNILGEVQSGHIAKIGLDLFLEMLEAEVRRLKGEKPSEEQEAEISMSFAARIPESYVSDSKERLRLYKSLSVAKDETGLAELKGEIRDRYGAIPEELENFMAALAVKRVVSRLGASKADLSPQKIVLSWEGQASAVRLDSLLNFVQANPGLAKLLPPGRLELKLDAKASLKDDLLAGADKLSRLAGES